MERAREQTSARLDGRVEVTTYAWMSQSGNALSCWYVGAADGHGAVGAAVGGGEVGASVGSAVGARVGGVGALGAGDGAAATFVRHVDVLDFHSHVDAV